MNPSWDNSSDRSKQWKEIKAITFTAINLHSQGLLSFASVAIYSFPHNVPFLKKEYVLETSTDRGREGTAEPYL